VRRAAHRNRPMTYALRAGSRALLAGSNLVPASGSQSPREGRGAGQRLARKPTAYIPDHDGSDPLTSCDLPRWHPVLLRGEDHPAYVPQPAQFHDHRDGSSGAPGPPAHSIARARWCRSLVPPQSDMARVARRALSAGGPLRWRGAYWRCMSALAGRTMACLAKEREGRPVVVFGAVFAVIGLATFAYAWWVRQAGLRAQGVAKRRKGDEVRAVCVAARAPMRLSWAIEAEASSGPLPVSAAAPWIGLAS